MNLNTRFRLSLMMFLEYFVWGAWYVSMGSYMSYVLKANGLQIGSVYATLSIAALISPFLTGVLADRFFSAQKVMGVLHLLGAAFLAMAATCTQFSSFYVCMLLATLSYIPTIALSNQISFHQMIVPEKEFTWIRVFGTLGWIAVSFLIDFEKWNLSKMMFVLAACSTAFLGLFCFFLPDTPPRGKNKKTNEKGFFQSELAGMFRSTSFTIFVISSILICIPLSFYFAYTNLFLINLHVQNPDSIGSLGQFSELFFLAAIPFLFQKIGVKWMISIAMLAWCVRFLLFAYGNTGPNEWMLYAGIIIHGVCYDFVFVTGQIFTDKRAGLRVKSAAQGMITFITYGIGMFIGSYISGIVTKHYTINDVYQWKEIWIIPSAISAFALLFFLLFFREKKEERIAESSLEVGPIL